MLKSYVRPSSSGAISEGQQIIRFIGHGLNRKNESFLKNSQICYTQVFNNFIDSMSSILTSLFFR